MTFDPKNYVSSNETIILSGTVRNSRHDPNLYNFVLTSKKIIQSGNDRLQIMAINQIKEISSDGKELCISTGTQSMTFYEYTNTPWYERILEEIAKRIG